MCLSHMLFMYFIHKHMLFTPSSPIYKKKAKIIQAKELSILKVRSKYNPDIKRFHTHMENNCISSKQRKDIKVISEINTC